MEKMKILLVDDKKENLFALQSLLGSEEIEFQKATSGTEALELLLVHDFAVALLDVQMPEMDGFELAELMRGAERTRAVPIIFVTAGAHNRQSTFRGYEKGAVDFLYKPLDPHIVKSKVQVFIELARQRQLLRHQLEETQRALAARDEALATAKEALRTRDEFMTIASHELKTPVTSLKLQLQMSKRRIDPAKNLMPTPAQLTNLIDVSNRQVTRLAELIEDLLDVARIRAGRLEFTPQATTVAEIVEEVTERFADQLDHSENKLTIDVPQGIAVEWDRSRIEQVLVNFVSNSIKYAPGTLIHIAATAERDHAVLSVRDEGPGIPKDRQPKIFERFERATASRSISGLGIGLYIANQIVRGHCGRLRVESEEGKGAKFIAEIPLRPFSTNMISDTKPRSSHDPLP
jgi:signal transduction histidine kinase